jgi:hypothetical protein
VEKEKVFTTMSMKNAVFWDVSRVALVRILLFMMNFVEGDPTEPVAC